jgi:hypothetical protein
MSPIVTRQKQRNGPYIIELNEGEVLYEGKAGILTTENKATESQQEGDLEDLVDQLFVNAKEISEKTKNILEETKITDTLLNGTKKFVDSSKQLSQNVYNVTTETFSNF